MPAPPDVTIRRLTRPDTAVVKRLWSDRFGGDPETQKSWIGAALDASHSVAGLVADAAPADEIIGLSFLDVADRAYVREYLGLDVLDLRAALADRNGVFHLSCVRSDWEGCGVGSAFYERRLALLRKRNVPRAVGIAWHRPHTVDSRVLFEKYGFSLLATVDHYYAQTGERPHCPKCDGPCSCTASLYSRAIRVP